MLELFNRHKLKNSKIILLQGENGRQFIKKKFTEQGLNFCVIECYKKVLKNLNLDLEIKKWRFYKINTLVITSASILKELNNLISKTHELKWLLKCKIFVISERLKKIAINCGWTNIIVSQYANNAYLLKVIEKNFD